ncbi:MAG: Peptidase, partial [Candidatus Parcubacteria bacterium]
ALISYLILNTINPQILSTNLKVNDLTISNVGGGAVADGAGTGKLDQEKSEVSAENGYGSSTYDGKPFTKGAADPNAWPGYSDYAGNTYTATDNSDRTGTISGTIQYLKDYVPTKYPRLEPTSTYRSPEWNATVGGVPNSDHVRGKAIDFHSASGKVDAPFSSDGNALVDYLVANGRSIGVDQIIFEKRNYIANGAGWREGNPVAKHDNHVHIGLE